MLPYPGIPYGVAPAACFPITEFCAYVLFAVCFVHAARRGVGPVAYLLGGLLFGVLLEYVNIASRAGYVYGQFLVMVGRGPLSVPLWIGVGWAVILYSSRLFTDRFRMPLWSAAALDALLALNIDLSMDVVAYRLHMWHWGWKTDFLTMQWFGVPYANFYGWVLVVFYYSGFSRLLARLSIRSDSGRRIWAGGLPVVAVLLAQVALWVSLFVVSKSLSKQFGIPGNQQLVGMLAIMLALVGIGWQRRRQTNPVEQPVAAWLVPLWFHLYFFAWFFVGGFYAENPWMTAIACVNGLVGVLVHLPSVRTARPKPLARALASR